RPGPRRRGEPIMSALGNWWRRDRVERDMNAEFAYHIDRETEKWVAAGVPPDAARTRAVRSLGPMDKPRADVRQASGISWFDELLQDLRYGLRSLARNPGYAALAIVTLGLGIGANTAIFSVINGVLLKPLPYEHGDRLMVVRQSAPLAGQATTGVAIAEYFDY